MLFVQTFLQPVPFLLMSTRAMPGVDTSAGLPPMGGGRR